MNIVVISGSTRDDSQSRKVADYLLGRLQEFGAKASLLDLNEQRLPLYDDKPEDVALWQTMQKDIVDAEGFVFVSPEWDGMFGVGLHNLFNYVASGSPNIMAHKPVTLASVSSGMGGSYPLAQMRMTGTKNTHYVVSPENIRISHVKETLVDGKIVQEGVHDRADYSLKVLLEYAKALKPIRESGLLDFEKFGSGV